MENRKRKKYKKYFKDRRGKPFITTNCTETGEEITLYEGEEGYKELKEMFNNFKKEYGHEEED